VSKDFPTKSGRTVQTPAPVWEWQAGNLILLSLPMELDRSIIILICAVLNGGTMSMQLLISKKWTWVWVTGLAIACLQGGLAIASLWAWRLQKKRARQSVI
jgi:hypothetical protein